MCKFQSSLVVPKCRRIAKNWNQTSQKLVFTFCCANRIFLTNPKARFSQRAVWISEKKAKIRFCLKFSIWKATIFKRSIENVMSTSFCNKLKPQVSQILHSFDKKAKKARFFLNFCKFCEKGRREKNDKNWLFLRSVLQNCFQRAHVA